MILLSDAIHGFLDGCFKAGIKDPVAFLLSKRPQVYDWLKGAFPRGILPTDVDGEVEINGNFLRLEFKHDTALRGGFIPRGQRQALMKLLATGKFTVLIIGFDQRGDPTCVEKWRPTGECCKLQEATKQQIYELCSKWARWAEKQSSV